MKSSRPTAGHGSISVGSGICCRACCWYAPFHEARREQRSRHTLDAGWALLCMAFIVISATVEGRGLGYATIVLFVALGVIMTLALTRLEWLGGDRFVIGSLVTIVALIGIFIVWPSIAISSQCSPTTPGSSRRWRL